MLGGFTTLLGSLHNLFMRQQFPSLKVATISHLLILWFVVAKTRRMKIGLHLGAMLPWEHWSECSCGNITIEFSGGASFGQQEDAGFGSCNRDWGVPGECGEGGGNALELGGGD